MLNLSKIPTLLLPRDNARCPREYPRILEDFRNFLVDLDLDSVPENLIYYAGIIAPGGPPGATLGG